MPRPAVELHFISLVDGRPHLGVLAYTIDRNCAILPAIVFGIEDGNIARGGDVGDVFSRAKGEKKWEEREEFHHEYYIKDSLG
ncbi:hypothetical protein BM221_006044 [Beauveria bassiana]|uniref:Uncharacterized protein n=1 Tax=Beauveria bassiana TaxID=176275 RepID=A0A2N6NKR6_BEABA|nr:hypothetical protein BM221_006044 [Beauveria bassiana]